MRFEAMVPALPENDTEGERVSFENQNLVGLR